MAWPLPSDYAEAIQNPAQSFADPDLRAAQAATDRMGLPRPITGNFASVFKMAGRGRAWAVRCFLRDVPGIQQRYATISAHLAQVRLPYMVEFEYQPRGIRVRGTWYPIVKMAWIEGQPLDQYVAAHLHEPGRLVDLAQKWVQLVADLRRAGIAHGDLQHGNILVINDQFKLVDYDGMFVPALAGQASNEIGHRNYQHPRRDDHLFNLDLDAFSAWTIYISLVALSIRPQLWTQVRGGDECLLFRYDDFVSPGASPIWRAIAQARDPRLDALVSLFRGIMAMPVEQIPALDEAAGMVPGVPGAPAYRRTAGSGDWLKDYTSAPAGSAQAPAPRPDGNAPAARQGAVQAAAQAAESAPAAPAALPPTVPMPSAAQPVPQPAQPGASWLFDYFQPAAAPAPQAAAGSAAGATQPQVAAALPPNWAPPAFQFNPWVDRAVLGAYLLFLIATGAIAADALSAQAAASMLYLQTALAIDAVATATVGTFMIARYRGLELVSARRALRRESRNLQHRVDRLTAELKRIDNRLQLMVHEEKSSESKAHHAIEEAADRYQAQRTSLLREEAEEITGALRALQESHVSQALVAASLDKKPPLGIGAKTRMQLRQAGVKTAADVNFQNVVAVRGIGAVKLGLLLNWRRTVENEARMSMPQSLPQDLEKALRGKWAKRLATVDQTGADGLRAITNELGGQRQAYAQRRGSVDQEAQAVRRDHFALSLKLMQVSHQLNAFPPISFGTYAGSILGRKLPAAANAQAPARQWPQWRLPRPTLPAGTARRIGCMLAVLFALLVTCGVWSLALYLAYQYLPALRGG